MPGGRHRQRRAVPAGGDPLPSGLHADELHAGIRYEGGEDPHRVRSATDTGDDPGGKPPLLLEDLLAGLVPDHALKVAHQRGIRRGAHDRADHVVRVLDVRDPVADRGGRRLLEGLGAGVDRLHRRPEQLHPLHIGPLADRVLDAHVDHALHAEQRTDGRRRHAVLSRAGLGDDPALAHAPCQQHLAQRVVELVRPGVVEVLALEVDRPAGALGEPAGPVEGRGATGEVAQQPVELAAVGGILAGAQPCLLELRERGHQCLGHELPAVLAEAVLDRGVRGRLAHPSAPAGAAAASAAPTARNSSRSFSGSLCPGADSVPLALSTAYGCVTEIARPTFSAVSPPLRISGILERRPAHQIPVEASRRCLPAAPPGPSRSTARRADGSRHGSARGPGCLPIRPPAWP